MKKIFSCFIILLSLIESSSINAQSANINISNGTTYDGEPYIAVNPTNNQNMVVAWMGLALGGIPRVAIKSKTTFDGGATWNNLVVHPHGGATLHSADVSMTFRNDGTLFISYIDYSEITDSGGIYIQQSTDGGVTWTSPVQVWRVTEDLQKEPIDRPWLVIDNSATANAGTLYITTKPAPGIPPPNRPYLKVSADSGQTWSAFRYVDSTGYLVGNFIAAPMGAPAVTSDGALCIAYPCYVTSQSIYPQINLAKSYNRALGFNYTNIYTGLLGTVDTNYKGGYRLAADPVNANRLCFATVANLHGDPDIFAITSSNGGTTWAAPVRVNDDSLHNGVGQDMVWAQYSANGDLLVTWRDRRNAADTGFYQASDFYAAVSHNNGATFGENVRLSNVTAAFDSVLMQSGNDFMSCYLVDDTINAVWGDVRSGKLNIYFVKASDSTGINTGVVTIAEEDAYDAVVYPVPAKDYFTVALPGVVEKFDIELLNTEGKILMKKEHLSSGDKVNCAQLPSGNYFLKIYTRNSVNLKQVVILK